MEKEKITIEITCPKCKSVIEMHNISDIDNVIGKKISCGNCTNRYTKTKINIKK